MAIVRSEGFYVNEKSTDTFRFVAQRLNHCATAVPSWPQQIPYLFHTQVTESFYTHHSQFIALCNTRFPPNFLVHN